MTAGMYSTASAFIGRKLGFHVGQSAFTKNVPNDTRMSVFITIGKA